MPVDQFSRYCAVIAPVVMRVCCYALLICVSDWNLILAHGQENAKEVPDNRDPPIGQGITCWGHAGGKWAVWIGRPCAPFDVDSDSLADLAKLEQIESIFVYPKTGLKASDFAVLGKLKCVRRLQITWFGDDCRELIVHIGKCNGLESLSLFAPKLKANDLKWFDNFDKLTELFVKSDDISAEHIHTIVNLDCGIQALRISSYVGDNPTFEDLVPVFQMDKLTRLEIDGENLSESEKRDVIRLLGNCDVRMTCEVWSEVFTRL